MSIEEFCEATGVPKGTVSNWISQKKIKSAKLAGRRLISMEVLRGLRRDADENVSPYWAKRERRKHFSHFQEATKPALSVVET